MLRKNLRNGLRLKEWYFYWQNGYGVFSIGKSQVNTLTKYIQNQEEHHRKKSFKEEFLEILNRSGIEYDERYLWD